MAASTWHASQSCVLEKLRGEENYTQWSILMKAQLVAEQLWTQISPGTRVDDLKSAQAIQRIFFSLDRTPLGHVRDAKTPKEAWKILKDLYSGVGPTKLIKVLRSILNTKIENFENSDDYVVRITDLAGDLADTNFGTVSEHITIAFLCAGLNRSYESLCQSIEDDNHVKLADVKRRIRETWLRLRSGENDEDRSFSFSNNQTPGFFGGNRYFNSNSSFNRRPQGKGPQCAYCKLFGHIRRNCPKLNQQQQQQQQYEPVQNRGRGSFGSFPPRRRFQHANAATEEIDDNEDYYYDDDEYDENEYEEASNLAAGRVVPGFIALSITPNRIYSGWYLDSGATRHMCAQRELFANLRTSTVKKIRVADRGLMDVLGEGDIYVTSRHFGPVMFKNVLFIPNVAANLISVACIDMNGGTVLIKNGKCEVFSSEVRKVVLTGKIYHKGLYKLDIDDSIQKPPETISAAFLATPQPIDLWHKRLAHLCPQLLSQLQRQAPSSVQFAKGSLVSQCEACAFGKLARKPFHPTESRAEEKL